MTERHWRLVSLITGWHVAASVCYYAVFAGSTFLREAFSLSGVAVGLVITALTLGYAVFLLPLGVATDRFGEHRTLPAGLLVLAVGVVSVAFAPTYGLVLAAAFVLGSAYGVATPGTNKAIFDNVDPGRQHGAIGVKQVGPPLGSAVSSLLVTGLVVAFVWQAGFLVAGGLGVVAAVLFARWYEGAGAVESSPPSFRGLLADRAYLLLVAAGSCLGAVFYTTTGYTVIYVEDSLGATVAVGGAVLALLQVASSVGRMVAGWLGDALPGEPRGRLGGILTAQVLGGGTLFVFLPLANTPVEAAVAFSLLGLLALGSTGIYYSLISVFVDDDTIGSASAGGQLAATSGGLFGPPVFGYLVDAIGYGAGWRYLGGLSFVAVGMVVVALVASRGRFGTGVGS